MCWYKSQYYKYVPSQRLAPCRKAYETLTDETNNVDLI